MKILFFGTPEFGADILKFILETTHEIVGVVCQVDKKGNRNKIIPCKVKELAIEQGLKILQFEDINMQASFFNSIDADIWITAAYGGIFSKELIKTSKYGIVNVHPSLLPKYRGATPVQSALINGDRETGVSIARTVEKLDSGQIFLQERIEILESDNSESLLKKTALVGGRLLVKVLGDIEANKASARPQDEAAASYTKKITNETRAIDWTADASKIVSLIKGLSPEPAAFCELNEQKLLIYDAQISQDSFSGENGEVVKCDGQCITIKCGRGCVNLLELQTSGGRRLKYKDFVNGRKLSLGDKLK